MKEQVKCAMAIFGGGNARGPCQGRDEGKLAFQMLRIGRKGTAGGVLASDRAVWPLRRHKYF